MDKNKLAHLKEKFFELSQFKFIFSEPLPEFANDIVKFQELIEPIKEKISQSQDIEDLRSGIKEILQITGDLRDKAFSEDNTKAQTIFDNYYYKSGLNPVDVWIDEQSENYDNKKLSGFLKNTSSALKNIFGISDESSKNEKLSEETINLGKELIKKYNLSHIDFSAISTNEDAQKFLTNFDEKASIAYDKLGTTYDILGLDGNLSLSYNKAGQPFYDKNSKTLSFDLKNNSSTILHEWTHALDNFVCQRFLNKNEFVSENQTSQVDDGSPLSEAYKGLRQLTQSLYNNNKETINEIKDRKLEYGSSKFYSIVLGNDWYTLTEEKRNHLLSDESIKQVNNYLSADIDSDNYALQKRNLLNQFAKAGVPLNENTLDVCQKELENEVKPFFDEVNKNIIKGKSLYYIGSQISNYIGSIPETIIGENIEKLKNVLGIESKQLKSNYDNNYFSKPDEMLARYFESQIFPNAARLNNLLRLTPFYKVTKDKDFDEQKNAIVENLFGKDKILKNIREIREDSISKSNTNSLKI